MNFATALKNQWINYSKSEGRAGRLEFAYWSGFVFIVQILLIKLEMSFIFWLFGFAVAIPSINLSIRRLHDANFSGVWFVLLLLFGLFVEENSLASLIPIAILLALPPSQGTNKYDNIVLAKQRRLIKYTIIILAIIALVILYLLRDSIVNFQQISDNLLSV